MRIAHEIIEWLGGVSIHASVMDAKPSETTTKSTSEVSIHASVMDANPRFLVKADR